MGIFFLIVGIIKLRDLDSFTEDVFNYQILFPPYDAYAAYLIAWLEVIAGALVAIGLWGMRGGLMLISGMICSFIIALSVAASKGLNINCGCFGSSEEPTNFTLHIGFNMILLLISVALLTIHLRKKRHHIFGKKRFSLPTSTS